MSKSQYVTMIKLSLISLVLLMIPGFELSSSLPQNAAYAIEPHDNPTIPFAVFAPDTPDEVVAEYFQNLDAALGRSPAYNLNDRWTTTATNGSGIQMGDPITITWSIVPDGTAIGGFNGEPAAPSDLINFFDGIYGGTGATLQDRPWFPLIEGMFDRWAALTGVTYVYEPNDDGVSLGLSSGVLGTRGDVRIGGHLIDGNSGVLAYNFYPNNSDMVIDTADNFYTNTGSNSLRLRNVLAHEHGHGLGIFHVCPVNQTKLMEPFLTTSFDGPQHDDILAGNRGYGDPLEPNDTRPAAHDLGFFADDSNVVNDVSIDDDSDDDYFKFTVASNTEVNITLQPIGSTYLSGPQVNGSCTAGTSFNSLVESDLALAVQRSNGAVVTAVDESGAGGNETLTTTLEGGDYYVAVSGGDDAAQLYSLTLETAFLGPPVVDLSLTKQVEPATAVPGETITYTLEFINNGNTVAENVLITDTMPISVSVTSVISSGVSITNTGGTTWQVEDLAGSEGGTLLIVGQLNQPLAAGTDLSNEAVISSSSTESNLSNNQDDATVTILNAQPMADDDAFTVVLDSQNNNLAVLANDSDPNGDNLTITLVSTPDQGGTAVANGNIITYTPDAGFLGIETFSYTISDGNLTDTAVVTVTVQEEILLFIPIILKP